MTLPARKRPGPARSLTREQVFDAALDVMADDGLGAVSFRNVSNRLGVNPMALYTYIRDKDELLAGMYDTVMTRITVPVGGTDAEERLVRFYVNVRRLIMANADLHRLVRPAGLPGMDWQKAERLCGLFAELGFDARQTLEAQQAMLQFTFGNALFWAALGDDAVAPGFTASGAADIAKLETTEYPGLHAMVNAVPSADPESRFTAMLRVILEAHR